MNLSCTRSAVSFLFQSPSFEKDSDQKKHQLRWAFLSTFVLGLLAHGYAFLNSIFTSDALDAIYADQAENLWKISLGRFIKPIYQAIIRSAYCAPWFIGMLSLLFIALAVYLVVRLFDIKAPLLISLTAGIMATNLVVTLTAASFLHDFDCDMLALLLAVYAACAWRKTKRLSLSGVLCIVISLGLYQAYVSVCIMLVILCSLKDLLEGEKAAAVLKKGLLGCLMLLLGAILYAVILKLLPYLGFSLSRTSYNAVITVGKLNLSVLCEGILGSYWGLVDRLWNYWKSSMSKGMIWLVYAMLFLPTGYFCVTDAVRRKLRWTSLLLAAGLIVLIPPVISLSSILNGGSASHHLMYYSQYILYLMVLVFPRHTDWKNGFRRLLSVVCILGLCIMIFTGIKTSNSIYLVKEMQSNTLISLGTRILTRMEADEDYVPNETEVAFIGNVTASGRGASLGNFRGLMGINVLAGAGKPVPTYNSFAKLMTVELGEKMRTIDVETYLRLCDDPAVLAMPAFPAEESMRYIDGVLVVKLSN